MLADACAAVTSNFTDHLTDVADACALNFTRTRPVILLYSADVQSVKVYTESIHGSGCGTSHSRCGGGLAAARSNYLHILLTGLQSCCKNSEECSCCRRSLPLSATAPACLHLRVKVRARHLALGGVAHVRLQPKVIQVSGHRLVQRMRRWHAGQPLHTAQPRAVQLTSGPQGCDAQCVCLAARSITLRREPSICRPTAANTHQHMHASASQARTCEGSDARSACVLAALSRKCCRASRPANVPAAFATAHAVTGYVLQ